VPSTSSAGQRQHERHCRAAGHSAPKLHGQRTMESGMFSKDQYVTFAHTQTNTCKCHKLLQRNEYI